MAFAVPICLLSIYTLKHPEEMFRMSEQWRYKDRDVEPSEFMIDMMKFGSVFTIILVIIFFIIMILDLSRIDSW